VFPVDVLVCDAGGSTLRILDVWARPQRRRKLAVPRHKEKLTLGPRKGPIAAPRVQKAKRRSGRVA